MSERAAAADFAATLIHSRRTVLPKRLVEPGPDAGQLARILEAAAAAPDHREEVPWRFVVIPHAARERLATAFADALLERDATASLPEQQEAREKAFRSPVLLLAIARTRGGDEEITGPERLVSAGCAIQNMLLMGNALGFASSLTSGKALGSTALRALFGLGDHEEALCFMSFGTAGSMRKPRARPAVETYCTELAP